MKITFFGGVEGVTGSRYLVEHAETTILIDCGLFQGEDSFNKRNYEPFPIDPHRIQAIVLTHAHIDHTGYIPALVKKGFTGKIYCSSATFALCKIMLIDSAMLQQEDAKKINMRKKSKQHLVEPLYTLSDAKKSLTFFVPIAYDIPQKIGALECTLIRSGHILGSSFVALFDGKEKLTFSGDLGRPEQDIIKPRPTLDATDYLVLESTYGDRLHEDGNSMQLLKDEIERVIKNRGLLIIPAFAVGRTQIILYYLFLLRKQLPSIPIFLDSPMAINVTNLYCQFPDEHTLSNKSCEDAFGIATYIQDVKESEKLDDIQGPAIIIAGSGMATGGRVTRHLMYHVGDKNNTILFVGYQAHGTLGRKLLEGASSIKLYGQTCPVKAHISSIQLLSAHADYEEILAWLSGFKKAPKKVFLTHGEKESAESLKEKIEKQFGWQVVIPTYLSFYTLD